MSYPELYILRHGQTEWNAQNRMQGGLDSPLTDLGRQQAQKQHEILAGLSLDGFTAFASPQGRAAETARIALTGVLDPIRHDDRLVEIRVGDWEGRTRGELGLADSADDSGPAIVERYDRAPGGEGFAGLHARCQSFLNDLPGPAVLVTHGLTSRMLRLIVMGLEISELGNLPGGQGVVYHMLNAEQNRLG